MADDHDEDHISDMGCHLTWTELKSADRMALDQERRVLMQEILDYTTMPSKTMSVYNLLGFIDYSLDDHVKAIERFQNVLKMDSNNVNALSCLALIYRRQSLLKLYKEYAERLRLVVGKNDPEVTARAFADKAFAVKQFQQDDKRFTYMAYLVKAMEKSKRTTEGNLEKAEWCYEYANCLDRKDIQHIMGNAGRVQTEPVLRDAVYNFHKVILSRKAHPYVGRSWAKLGRLLERQSGRNFATILPNETPLHDISAQDCFNKALELNRDDAEVLCIVGAAYIKLERYEDALEMLTTSLKHKETRSAHRHCGLFYLQMWQSQQQRIQSSPSSSGQTLSVGDLSRQKIPREEVNITTTVIGDPMTTYGSGSNETLDVLQADLQRVNLDDCHNISTEPGNNKPSNDQTADIADTNEYVMVCKDQIDGNLSSKDKHNKKALLVKANESFNKAIQKKATHADHSDLGYVLYLIGEDLYQSVQHFSIAMRYPEGDEVDVAQTRARWAECLEALGEHQGAETQRNLQRQIQISTKELMTSLEESWKYTHGTNCQGYECDVSRHNYCSVERPGYVNILSEYNTPVSPQIRFLPRNPGDFKYNFFISFAHIDYKWSIALVQKIEKEFPGIRGRLRYRDYELGTAIADNIVNSIESSYRTLIILTPDSLRDHWCRYEVQRTHMVNLTRSCAIPILLRSCRIPREIEHLSVVKCDQGQLRIEDWYRLGKSLQQPEFH